jgi:small subunit ribosomal protein S1
VEDIQALLSVGQEIQASILKIDWPSERITLSMKSLLADPWETAPEKYPEGSKHVGKVIRLADFGAFVSLEPGIDGLVHSSELNKASSYGTSRELAVKVGQTLSVEILGVDRSNKRISLKPATSAEEDETTAKYLDASAGSTTYSPFAALLKKK